MQLTASRPRHAAQLVSAVFDRILIPLAVVVGLAGGAMIGSEIARLQAPGMERVH